MKKEIREKVYNKFDGRCAYCGKEIEYKQMQVDHIFPKAKHHFLNNKVVKEREGIEINEIDEIDNLNPACGRCNRYKSTMPIEQFREEISKQVERARKNSWNFRCAEDYGLIVQRPSEVTFYFEKVSEKYL